MGESWMGARTKESLDLPQEAVLDAHLALNRKIDRAGVPFSVYESQITEWVSELDRLQDPCCRISWLLCTRVFEAALLCAGNYADSAEYQAAGDLLVNPREVHVISRKTGEVFKKRRNGSLVDELRRDGQTRWEALSEISRNYRLETVKPPLLPELFDRISQSSVVTRGYLDWAEIRMKQVADTLTFLAGWKIQDGWDLHQRLHGSNPETGSYIRSHLCRFEDRMFRDIGVAVENLIFFGTGSETIYPILPLIPGVAYANLPPSREEFPLVRG
jgi:hypothetical protein